MTTIFTNRRDGRAGHSTVQFGFAIATTASLKLQLCKYGCSSRRSSGLRPCKILLDLYVRVRSGPDGVAVASGVGLHRSTM